MTHGESQGSNAADHPDRPEDERHAQPIRAEVRAIPGWSAQLREVIPQQPELDMPLLERYSDRIVVLDAEHGHLTQPLITVLGGALHRIIQENIGTDSPFAALYVGELGDPDGRRAITFGYNLDHRDEAEVLAMARALGKTALQEATEVIALSGEVASQGAEDVWRMALARADADLQALGTRVHLEEIPPTTNL